LDYVREVSENEIILVFLQGEYKSDRFSENLRKIMMELSASDTLIFQADLNNAEEKTLQRKISECHRGYPAKDLFKVFRTSRHGGTCFNRHTGSQVCKNT